jgi:hypothetical protein
MEPGLLRFVPWLFKKLPCPFSEHCVLVFIVHLIVIHSTSKLPTKFPARCCVRDLPPNLQSWGLGEHPIF